MFASMQLNNLDAVMKLFDDKIIQATSGNLGVAFIIFLLDAITPSNDLFLLDSATDIAFQIYHTCHIGCLIFLCCYVPAEFD